MSVEISGKIGVINGDLVGGNKGVDAEALVSTLNDRGVLAAAELAGLQRRTVVTLARRLTANSALDFIQAVEELERAVDIALDVISRGERGTNHDAIVNKVLAQVAAHLRNNDLDGSAVALKTALAELDAHHLRSRIALLEECLRINTLRHDPSGVTASISGLIAAEYETDRPEWHRAFRARYESFRAEGEARGISLSAEVAVELARRMKITAVEDRERGTACVLLGNALALVGAHERDTSSLEQAVEAFQAALCYRRREQMPLEWAQIQNNLGAVYQTLGMRKRGTEEFLNAIKAFRLSLEERTRLNAPCDWAMTLDNLGIVLHSLGLSETGTASFKQAEGSYRLALEERTRERDPLGWAITKHHLGVTLSAIGERDFDITSLEASVIEFREALKECTRDKTSLGWALLQCNLGSSLALLGTRTGQTEHILAAVAVFREALDEQPRDRVPFDWALTQNNLGNALSALASHESGISRFEEAITAYHAALEERTRLRVPLDWALTKSSLGRLLSNLGDRELDERSFGDALNCLKEALLEITEAGAPLDWMITKIYVGKTYLRLGLRAGRTSDFESAVSCFDEALKVLAGLSLPEQTIKVLEYRQLAQSNGLVFGNRVTVYVAEAAPGRTNDAASDSHESGLPN